MNHNSQDTLYTVQLICVHTTRAHRHSTLNAYHGRSLHRMVVRRMVVLRLVPA